MYSAALTDPDVRALLAQTQPGSRIMPSKCSSDQGTDGSFVLLPVRTSTGATTACIAYGQSTVRTRNGQFVSLPLRVMFRSDGSALAAYQGRMAPPPPEASDLLQSFHLMLFPNEYLDRRIAAAANSNRSVQGQATPDQGQSAANQGQPMASDRPTRSQCESAFTTRTAEIRQRTFGENFVTSVCLAALAYIAGSLYLGLLPFALGGGVVALPACATSNYFSRRERDLIREAEQERIVCISNAIDC